jgi:Zn ribbon nucleic-acid-binding protein
MASEQMDQCPRCNKFRMPTWNPEGLETGRSCQACGHVEDRIVDPSVLKPQFSTKRKSAGE